jgi:hypothetical protein
MKKAYLSMVFVLSATILLAQQSTDSASERPKNNIYANFGGDASIVSINYERLLLINPHFFLSGKVGVGYNTEFDMPIKIGGVELSNKTKTPPQFITSTHHITANYGERKWFFEFGLGGTVVGGNTDMKYLLYPIAGFRLQPLKSKKVNLRAFACPPLGKYRYTEIWFVPVGISVGVSL